MFYKRYPRLRAAKSWLALLLILLTGPLLAQRPDSTRLSDTLVLSEVVVRGYENNRPLLETAGSVAVLNRQDLARFSNTSLVPALNTVAGVRMEERTPASYRISIRGSTLRSPFGVRNVKVYWNDIPLTDPGGNTALNIFDFNTVGSIEIIKGPGGSLYGAGIGGVILLQSPKARVGEQRAEVSALAGSFGLRGLQATVQAGSARENIVATVAHQQADGYRDHTAMRRQALHLRGQFATSNRRTVSVYGLYTHLAYQLPGGLTLAEFTRNPRSSRPRAIGQNSSIDTEVFNLGVAQTYQITDQFSNVTALYGTFTRLDNPFLTDYKRNAELGAGGRTKFVYATQWGGRFTLGGEWQRNFASLRNYGNRNGRVDTLRFDDEITATQGLAFAQVELDLPRQFFLTVGGSFSALRYDITRLSEAATNPNYAQTRRFQPTLSPRVALLKKFGRLAAHASVSWGFSPPTPDDVRTSDGSLNLGLEAERGISYEVGLRGDALGKRWTFDLALFSLRLRDAITTFTNAAGVALFRNAGATQQRGIELQTAYSFVSQASREAKVFASYTLHDFSFRDYVSAGNDFSGNRLTGTPLHTLAVGADLTLANGFYTNLTFNYVDRLPLNDANTVYANAYALLGGRLGYRRTLGHVAVSAFVGVDNALDRVYSLGNDLNAFGGRYYQPAANRNYYAGLALSARK